MKSKKYFEELSFYAHNLLDKLPIKREVQPLEYTLLELKNSIDDIKTSEIKHLNMLWIPEPIKLNKIGKSIGLNTIGMLSDRLTILLIKEWCFRNKICDQAKADKLYATQTKDIIEAMANSIPGNSSINSKITNLKTDVKADSWEEAFYGLLTVNLLLWESQEVLYIKDIATLPAEELRNYISWFARGNMQRNSLIELCEIRFWEKINMTVK